MSKAPPLEIHVASLLRWVLPPVLAATAFGILPTWLLNGWTGVIGGLLSVFTVLGVMVATGSITVYAARQGASQAATVFLGCSLLRMILSPLLVGLVWLIVRLPSKAMAVWLVITYLMGLGLEVAWLVRALRRSPAATGKPPSDETNEQTDQHP